jgi:hypothetical protein
LEFDEALKYATGGSSTTAAYDFVIEANGEVLDANYDYTVAIDDEDTKKVNITLIGDYETYDGPVYISTADKVKTIVDCSKDGNALADIDDEEIEVATTPTVEIVQTVVGTVYKNVVCTFNEEMDVATLVGANFIFDDEELLATFTVNDDGDVLTIGLSDEPEDNETALIITDGVTDYSGTKFAPSKFVYNNTTRKWDFYCYMKWDKESESWKEVAGV